MKNFTSTSKKGFTLIELLIVIVILGLLAAVVLAAINPVEARNKAVDTANKADASQVVNALDRYFTSKGSYPWGATAPSDGTAVSAAWLTTMVNSGEIKPEFQTRGSISNGILKVYTYTSAGATLVRVCFTPASNEFKSTAKFTSAGAIGSAGGTGNIVCVPD